MGVEDLSVEGLRYTLSVDGYPFIYYWNIITFTNDCTLISIWLGQFTLKTYVTNKLAIIGHDITVHYLKKSLIL